MLFNAENTNIFKIRLKIKKCTRQTKSQNVFLGIFRWVGLIFQFFKPNIFNAKDARQRPLPSCANSTGSKGLIVAGYSSGGGGGRGN